MARVDRATEGRTRVIPSAIRSNTNNMASSGNTSSSSGIGFFGMLAILFIGLKLTGFINWSWWWVLAPIWGPALLVAIVLLVILGAWGISKFF